jgi:hypothetical protein
MLSKKATPTRKANSKSATPKKGSTRELIVQIRSRGREEQKAGIRERLEALEEYDKVREATARRWMEQLEHIASDLNLARQALREAKYKALADVYDRYLEIEASGDMRSEFYHNLRIQLLDKGYKVQKNTPDAGLLIRLVWGNSSSASSINQYVNALRAAQQNEVVAENFVTWIKSVTISKAANKLTDETDRRKERLERARIHILNYLDWRETHPYLVGRLQANRANQYVTKDTHLVVMIGTVIRQEDRTSDYANIYVSHILPPNFDLDIKIIDKWAKYIEPKIEHYEAEAERLPIEQWAAMLEDELWAFDVAEAEKQSVYWALRQQASRYEDQQEFAKHAQAYKKERLNTSKAVKKAKK